MKYWTVLLAAVLAFGAFDAEAARRLGGGGSIGRMSPNVTQRQSLPPAAAPTSPANAQRSATPQSTPATTPAAQPQRSRWGGMLGGLAAGLGLAALASHLGFGEELANMLMIGLMVMAALAVIGFIMRKRAAASQGGMAYAGAAAGAGGSNNAFRMPASPVQTGGAAAGGSMIGANLQGAQPRIPADFDVAAFERNAKVNYIRLQAANDTGNLDDIRQFTSPEMFAELQMDIRDRNGATQHTDVLSLNAQVLEVAEEDALYVVSVRFTGELREDGVTSPVDEIWHLTKPRQGNGGWILAGIQQGA